MDSAVQEIVQAVRQLFFCRQDVYAAGYLMPTGKIAYPPARTEAGADLALTDEAIYSHMKGDLYLGVYPLFDESKVQWLAMDFDGDGEEDPFEAAKRQKAVFYEEGIISYVERSRSGNGAHVWIFLDEPIEARVIRELARSLLIDASTFDRMFPNQDTASGGYGNLIALPYQGNDYRGGNSTFVDDTGVRIPFPEFIKDVKKNSKAFLMRMYEDNLPNLDNMVEGKFEGEHQRQSLSGALKVVTFSNWMKAARERMSGQGQEPEFYALCCQFAQLEDGERLAYEFGRLHPYSDARIAQKFEQAKQVNKPHSCRTLREDFGWEETADTDHGVTFPYELATIPFGTLMAGRKGRTYSWDSLGDVVVSGAKERFKSDERYGWAYGYDRLDDLSELRPGNLLILGARSKVGKTSWAIDLTANLTTSGLPVYWASIEMMKEELGQKFLSRLSEVPINNIRKGDLNYREWRQVLSTHKDFNELPLFVDDETSDLDRLIDIFGGLVATNGPGLIVLDYIELVGKLKGESDFGLVGRVVVELKALAKILKVPILALSNFNRKAEQDLVDDVDPMDGWLRHNGLVEQTADVILYLLGKQGEGVLERKVIIQKERHSGNGGAEFNLWYEGAIAKFHSTPPARVARDLRLGGLGGDLRML